MPDEKYCYPNSNVLINKLGIRDFDKLQEAERKITRVKIAKISDKPVKGDFNLKHLQSIHKAIFSDIYDWAGKNRTVDIAKSNLFCRAQFLDSYSQDIFSQLKRDKYLIGMDKDRAIAKLAEYMGDINALHPFREGNGRSQRQFITYLAEAAGIQIDFTKVDSDRMMEASLKSFVTDYSGFKEIFEKIAEPISLEIQEKFLKNISPEAYKTFEGLKLQGLLPDREAEFNNGDAGQLLSEDGVEHNQSRKPQGESMDDWKAKIAKEKAENPIKNRSDGNLRMRSGKTDR